MTISLMYMGKDDIAFIKPENLSSTGFYVFFMETFFTFLMMLTILHGKNAKLSLFNDAVPGCFASMVGIYFCMSCIGKITGAVMNPNVGICNVVFCAIALNNTEVLPYLPAYFFGPYFGSIFAAFYVKYFALRTLPTEEK